jgi:5-methylcytosine-specific restriction protein A
VTLTVGVEALRGGGSDGSEGAPELDHTGPTSAATARRITCDAAVMRVVMAGPSQPLDVGRRTKIVSPALRRAVIVRDRICRFPGCGRPHTWCDAHHVRHWADGGVTSLENLLLLCRPHHRAVHRPRGFTVGLQEGRPVFRRPDGSVLEAAGGEGRAPP